MMEGTESVLRESNDLSKVTQLAKNRIGSNESPWPSNDCRFLPVCGRDKVFNL